MSRTRFGSMLANARAAGRAVGAFTCYDTVGLEAVLSAAEARRAPVIVLVSPSSFRGTPGERLAAAFGAAAANAGAIVQLDHVSERESIASAVSAGFDAVMADGSKLGFDDNAALVRFAVEAGASHRIGVEAELGRVEGHEDRAQPVLRGNLTDPDEVDAFVERSGVDCLAVAVGNVHGHYAGMPEIDWHRLERIASSTQTPIALHGASGLSDDDLRRAVSLGVAKVNVNTELRSAYFDELLAREPDCREGLDLLGLGKHVCSAVRYVVEAKLDTLGWPAEDGA